MTRAATTLEYEKHAPPNRYEWELESERARVLRRRFLWFTGTLVVLGVLQALAAFGNLFSGSGYTQASGALELAAYSIQAMAAAWAWWYARGRVRNERRLFAIAFWLVAGLGVLIIFTNRVAAELSLQATLSVLESRSARSARVDAPAPGVTFDIEDVADIDPEDGPAAPATPAPAKNRGGGVNPAIVRGLQQGTSLMSLTWAVFISHLLACLFLPWTVREAARPAWVLLSAAGLLVVVDLVLGRASVWYVAGAMFLLPLTVLPGIGWCWWRYSAFRSRYRSVFEGNQLRQLKQELTGARKIHEASLPPAFPEGPLRLSYIYEPMSQIGGDLIFVHPRPPEVPPALDGGTHGGGPRQPQPPPPRHTLVLLDVTGHGIAAALTVNRLVGELERIFAETPDIGVGQLMGALNRYVYLTLATHGVFVTGVAVRGDLSDHADLAAYYHEPHTVSFASAGHPTAFVRRADERIEPLESNATMLGVLPPGEYRPEEKTFRLRPGDAIVAYTDGAIEARNLEDEMIGIEGVRDLINVAARECPDPFHWPEHLIRRVASWRSAPPADDTLIAVIYRPPAPAHAAGGLEQAMERQATPVAAVSLATG